MSLLIFILIFILSVTWIFYDLNKKFQNTFYSFKLSLNPPKVAKELIIVEIWDDSLKELWYPLKRRFYAPVIDNLKKSWASIIAFDIIFSDKSNNYDDNIFKESIKKAKNIIFWLSIKDNGNISNIYEKFNNHIIWGWYVKSNNDISNKIIYSIVPFSKFKWDIFYEHFSINILKKILWYFLLKKGFSWKTNF
jgi:hypothetical protein